MTGKHSTPQGASPAPLFAPFDIKGLHLDNRIVIAPMTRCFCPGGVPGADVAAYYRRRAEGGTGLIITEGTLPPHPGAQNDPGVPHFYGEEALSGWKAVVEEVHRAGGKIIPQIWHPGLVDVKKIDHLYDEAVPHDRHVVPQTSPSGMLSPGVKAAEPMTDSDIADTIAAYGDAAENAKTLGFDGVEVHGAHGYLIDQFFWTGTNLRSDLYGGDLAARSRFAIEVLKECRRRVGPDFPMLFRLSQWKQQDYTARIVQTPHEMEAFLGRFVDAGVDLFHCSTRRFWEPEFKGSDLNFAGWAKKLTGKPSMTVGSVGLNREFMDNITSGGASAPASLDRLIFMLDRGDFDLVAVGRALIADPSWAEKIRLNQTDRLTAFHPEAMGSLV